MGTASCCDCRGPTTPRPTCRRTSTTLTSRARWAGPSPPEKDLRRRFRDERRDRERGEAASYVINDADGFIVLHSFAWEHMRADVGVQLALAARGRGIATTAMKLLVRWGLDVLGLQRIGLQTLPGSGACGLAERAGFTFEGTLHRYTREFGAPMDNVMYGIWA